MTPYEVSFLTSPQLANFILNRFVDVVFTLDIVLQFFLAYPEKHTFAGQGKDSVMQLVHDVLKQTGQGHG